MLALTPKDFFNGLNLEALSPSQANYIKHEILTDPALELFQDAALMDEVTEAIRKNTPNALPVELKPQAEPITPAESEESIVERLQKKIDGFKLLLKIEKDKAVKEQLEKKIKGFELLLNMEKVTMRLGGEVKNKTRIVTYKKKGSDVAINFYKVPYINDEQAISDAKKMYIDEWYEGKEEGKKQVENLDFVVENYADGGLIGFDNFMNNTFCNFQKIKSKEIPNRPPDYISNSGSKYWYGDNYVIRQSDHWGRTIASCNWLLDGNAKSGLSQGKCLLSEFESNITYKMEVGKKYRIKKAVLIRNGGGAMNIETLQGVYKGQTYSNYLFDKFRVSNRTLMTAVEVKEKGGSIPNNYEGKTAEQVWDEWSIKQREHFLLDHKDKMKYKIDDFAKRNGVVVSAEYAKKNYNDLNTFIHQVLKEHIEQGQYSSGGSVPKALKAERPENSKYWHVRFMNPELFKKGSIRTPGWSKKVANKISKGSKAKIGKIKNDGWKVQSILVSSKLTESEAIKIAEEIACALDYQCRKKSSESKFLSK